MNSRNIIRGILLSSVPILGVFGAILLLIWITTLFTGPALKEILGLSNDTSDVEVMNGITAPAIGIVGALLVFVSFREQVKANKLQSRAINQQRELDLLYRFYEELKSDLLGIQSIYGERYKQPSILDSLMTYIRDDKTAISPYPELTQYLKFLLKQFAFISKRIIRSKSISNEERVYLIEKLQFLRELYFDAYALTISKPSFTQPLGKDFQKSLIDFMTTMGELNIIHASVKDKLRKQAKTLA